MYVMNSYNAPPLRHALLQIIAGMLQLSLSLFNLREHRIERGCQRS